jgi:hypothetical protein
VDLLQGGNNLIISGPDDCQLVYTFVIGGAAAKEAPTERVDDGELMTVDRSSHPDYERDVTYLNIRENLKSGKTVTWFRYASSLSIRIADSLQMDDNYWIAKVDSDTVVYPNRFIDLLEREQFKLLLSSSSRNNNNSTNNNTNTNTSDHPARSRGSTSIYGGNLRPGSGYYKGGLYFMSKDVARTITSADCDRSKLTEEDLKQWDHPSEDRLTGYLVQKCCAAAGLSFHQMSLMKGVGWDHMTSLKKANGFRAAWERFLDKEIAKAKFQEVVQKYAYPKALNNDDNDDNDCLPDDDEVFSVALSQMNANYSTRIRKRFSKLVEQSKARCAEGTTQ